jgi:glycosyltransferase involved in cell wall biosynthesis
VIDQRNEVGAHLAFDDIARLVTANAHVTRPRAPTGNGFCMYLKRAAIDAVGELDAISFRRGYGEENDFCMRAGRLGLHHVIDDRTYVHHVRQASFGPEKTELAAAARRRMAELHPDYKQRVSEFIADPEMRSAREQVAAAFAAGANARVVRPRVLFVIHEGGGGAVATNRDLMSALSDEFDCFCLRSDRSALRLSRVERSESSPVAEWQLKRRLRLGDFSRPDYRSAFSAALDLAAPEVVHIRHLFKHTFDPPALAAARALPIVVSLHDHYFICPTIHLLDERGTYCGGECTPGAGTCPTVQAGSLPLLKHAFVHQWREEVEAALAPVDAFVTTSSYTREIHRRLLTVVRERPCELIEHGRDFTQTRGLAAAPSPGKPVRILVLGNLDRHKGADLLAAMCQLDHEHRLELHFLGDVAPKYRRLGVIHGSYQRDDLARWVEQIRPSFIGVFSVTGESYSHAISEAWAAGVPVLATDLGAQADRVRDHRGGFVIRHDDPAAALADVLAAAGDPEAYATELSRADAIGLPSVSDMASRYADLYREVTDRRRPFAISARTRHSPLGRGIWRVAALPAAGSLDSLVARRLLHPSVQWKLRARVCADPAQVDSEVDLVVVAQGALAPDAAQALVARLDTRGQALVFACDRWSCAGEADDVLLDASRLVLVEGHQLARLYSRRHPNVVAIDAVLDERLFLSPPNPDAGEDRPAQDHKRARLAYVTPDPQSDELDLLRATLELAASRDGSPWELEIATSAAPAGDGEWFRLVPIPDPRSQYQAYVAALRARARGWDIALAPQIGTDRGDLQFLEYAALGVAGVYSRCSEAVTITDQHGVVADNEPEAWYRAIRRVGGDAELDASIRAGARRYVIDSRLARQQAPELLAALGSALAAPVRQSDRPSRGVHQRKEQVGGQVGSDVR